MLLKASGPVRVISDPELKFSQNGKPLATFRVVADKKRKNEATGQWEDDKVMFARVTCFGPLAEHVAQSVQKGHTVVLADAEFSVSEWERKDGGGKGHSVEIVANEIGVSLRWDNATVEKSERGQSSAPAPTTDPWGGSAQTSENPPF